MNDPSAAATLTAGSAPSVATSGIDPAHRRVIVASSLGTIFEWYDFHLYGSLAAVIGKQFFAGVNDTTAFSFALLAFSAGFAVRPFGRSCSDASATWSAASARS